MNALRLRGAIRRSISLLATLLLVATACGLPIDDSPRTISSESLPPELLLGQLPTPEPTVPTEDAVLGRDQVYMLQDNRLVTVERPIAQTPQEVLESLLLNTFPAEAAIGISSAISRGARVQRVEVNDLLDLAIVDLAPNSLDPRNTEQRLAFAQFVYTLTSLDGIEQVQFVSTDPGNLDAGPIDLAVQTDSGSTQAGARVSRADFARLAASAVPEFDLPVIPPTPTPDPDAPQVVTLAVWMLDENDELVRVRRTVERSAEGLLVAVIEGPTLEEREQQGIRSAVPPDALPNSITVDSYDVTETDAFGFETLTRANIAIVDLGVSSLPNVSISNEDRERFLAVAQIVFTLTDLEEIDQVVFSVNGQFVPVPSDTREIPLLFDPNIPVGLRKSDYASALAEPLPTPPPTPVPTPPEPLAGDVGTAPIPAATPVPTPTPGE